jgi:hypothetical protein
MVVKDDGRSGGPLFLRGVADAALFGYVARREQRGGQSRPAAGLTATERARARRPLGLQRRRRKAVGR